MYLIQKKILQISTSIVLLAFAAACEENKTQQEYVAKVGDIILTEEGLENYLTEEKNNNLFKNEFVRQWVDEQLLFLEAENEGLTIEQKYLELLEISKRQIAGSIIIEKLLRSEYANPSESKLNEFYSKIKESFTITDNAYVLNLIDFSDEKSALDFRNSAVLNGWESAVAKFESDTTLVTIINEDFYFGYRLSPIDLSLSVQALNENEVSLVIQKEPSLFTVVQKVKEIQKNSIPEFELVKNEVEEIYYYEKQKEVYNIFLEKLYSKYNVEIKKVIE